AHVLDRVLRDTDTAQRVADRADVARVVGHVPAPVKLVGLEPGASSDSLQHVGGRLPVPVDERLPEVEDDRLDHAAQRRSASQVRRTSSSEVPALPIASRRIDLPPRDADAMNASPLAVTARAISSLSASTWRKQTIENE